MSAWSRVKPKKIFMYYVPILKRAGEVMYGKPCQSRQEAIHYIRLNTQITPEFSFFILHAGDTWYAHMDEYDWYESCDSRRPHTKVIDHVILKPIYKALKKIVV